MNYPKHPMSELSLITELPAAKIKALNQITPPAAIKQVSKRGGTYAYIPVGYVTKRLNDIFGHVWSWEIVRYDILTEHKQVVVHGRLQVMMRENLIIRKEQFGGADIKCYSKNAQPMDIADDLKGASSDALKKAASMLGIGLDVYAPVLDEMGLDEERELTAAEIKGLKPQVDIMEACTTEEELKEFGGTIKGLDITAAQRTHLRNEFMLRLQKFSSMRVLEPLMDLLWACEDEKEYAALIQDINTGKHGKFRPEETAQIMEIAKEVKAKFSSPSTKSND